MPGGVKNRARIMLGVGILLVGGLLGSAPVMSSLPGSALGFLGLGGGVLMGWVVRGRAVAQTIEVLPPGEEERLSTRIKELELENEKMFEELGDQERSIARMAASVRQRSVVDLAENYGLSLRNILSYSESLLTLLMDKMGDDASFRSWVDRLEKEVLPVSTFCESSLTIAASRESSAERVDLNSTIVRVAGLVSARFSRGGIRIEFDLAEDLPGVKVKPWNLCTAIVDILGNSGNAIANRRNARVHFRSFREEGGKIVLQVTDSRAISRVNLSKVFSATPLNSKRMFEGRFGYSVVKALFEEQDIAVDVDIDTDLDTTTVELKFEAAEESLRDASALFLGGQKLLLAMGVAKRGHIIEVSNTETTTEDTVSIKGKKFMLVDADREVTAAAQAALEAEGGLVEKVHDIKKARVSLISAKYDLIITDYRMSGMDADALMTKLLYKKVNLGSRIIFLATDGTDDEIREFLEEFKYPVLVKPFNPKQLVRLVQDVLKQRSLKKAS